MSHKNKHNKEEAPAQPVDAQPVAEPAAPPEAQPVAAQPEPAPAPNPLLEELAALKDRHARLMADFDN